MGNKMIVKNKQGVFALPIEDISLMEKKLRKIRVHTDYIVVEFYGKFSDVYPLLDERFLCCHRSYVINMERIVIMVDKGIYMNDIDPIFFGRDTYSKAKKVFNNYLCKRKRQEKNLTGLS